MTLREALHEFLRDRVNVNVFDGKLSQRPMMPALVQHNVSGRSTQTHTSPSTILPRRIQIDVWAQNDAEADELERKVIKELDGFHGLMGSVAIGWAALLNVVESAPVQIKGGEWRYRRILDFEIAHQRLEVSS